MAQVKIGEVVGYGATADFPNYRVVEVSPYRDEVLVKEMGTGRLAHATAAELTSFRDEVDMTMHGMFTQMFGNPMAELDKLTKQAKALADARGGLHHD